MKTVILFLATNLAVLILLSVILQILGIYQLRGLLILALFIGMGGALVSLALSKWSAKRATNAQVINQPCHPVEIRLIDTIRHQAHVAGIGMPEVAIYDSIDLNAFATGINRNNALIAVSTGLLQAMEPEEVEAVLAHEISHIVNGDMVTMALIQGVINTLVIVFAKVIGRLVDRLLFKNEDRPGFGYWMTSLLAEVILGLLASIIVMWFSRQREFRADAGSAQLVGAQKMIRALQRLKSVHHGQLPAQLSAFGINGSKGTSWVQYWFMSHPPLDERIEALRKIG